MTQLGKCFAILAAVLMLAACDNNNPTPVPTSSPAPPATNTPLSSTGGPTAPPLLATEVLPPVTSSENQSFLEGFPEPVTRMAWSPDGSILATAMGGFGGREEGLDTHAVWLWNANGTPVGQWGGHSGSVLSIAWSPDGELLATGSVDGTVKLWQRNSFLESTLQTGAGAVFSLSWTPDSERLAVGALKATDDNTTQIWNRDGTLEHTLHTQWSGGKFYNAAWSPDGNYLFGGAIDYSLWDSAGNVITTTYACEQCTPAWASAWSPDSKSWAIGNENGLVSLYSISGEWLVDMQAQSSVNHMAWSPDGTTIAITNELWKPGGTRAGSLYGFRSSITALDWSPDSTMIAASASGTGDTGLLGIFDAKGSELYRAENTGGQVNYVKWSPDGKTLAVAYESKTVRLLHVENGSFK